MSSCEVGHRAAVAWLRTGGDRRGAQCGGSAVSVTLFAVPPAERLEEAAKARLNLAVGSACLVPAGLGSVAAAARLTRSACGWASLELPASAGEVHVPAKLHDVVAAGDAIARARWGQREGPSRTPQMRRTADNLRKGGCGVATYLLLRLHAARHADSFSQAMRSKQVVCRSAWCPRPRRRCCHYCR